MTEQFIQHRVYLNGVSPKTAVWYECSFRQFAGALDSKQTIIGRIAELKQRGASHTTINSYLRAVNAYFMWLHTEHGKELVRIPRLKEEQKVLATLAADDVAGILKFKPKGTNLTRSHMAALTMLDTGLRASELLALTKEHVDFDNLVLKVLGKGGKHRLVPFSGELRKVLFRYANKSEGYIFGTRHKTKVTLHNLDRDFKALGKECGILGVRFTPHTMRHSFAVMYLRRGGNLEFLRRILGHSSILTTQKYLRSLGVEDLGAVHSGLSPLSAKR